MDILCPTCGEPWDNDELHDVADEQDRTYAEVAANFRVRGCVVFGLTCEPADPDARAGFAVIYELSGDDMDGAACEFVSARECGLI